MQTAIKLAISLAVILLATTIGKKLPSLAGLIGVMPLTGALVLIWLFLDTKGDPVVMGEYAKGALWGILPSILFFVVALICFKKQASLGIVLSASFGIWFVGALLHQWLLR